MNRNGRFEKNESLETINQDVIVGREELRNFDRSLIVAPPKHIDFNDVESDTTTTGRIVINCGGIGINCFINLKNKGTLYVFFNGANTTNTLEFKRWSYYKYIPGSMINIADPMLDIFPNIDLGWYYGTEEYDIRDIISKIVQKYVKKHNYSEIIFYSSSGGGSIAIDLTDRMEKSKAILINPQLAIDIYPYYSHFLENTKQLSRNTKVDLSTVLLKGKDIVIAYNLMSESDRIQMANIEEKTGIMIKYGLNKVGGSTIWVYQAPGDSPHSSPRRRSPGNLLSGLRPGNRTGSTTR